MIAILLIIESFPGNGIHWS